MYISQIPPSGGSIIPYSRSCLLWAQAAQHEKSVCALFAFPATSKITADRALFKVKCRYCTKKTQHSSWSRKTFVNKCYFHIDPFHDQRKTPVSSKNGLPVFCFWFDMTQETVCFKLVFRSNGRDGIASHASSFQSVFRNRAKSNQNMYTGKINMPFGWSNCLS